MRRKTGAQSMITRIEERVNVVSCVCMQSHAGQGQREERRRHGRGSRAGRRRRESARVGHASTGEEFTFEYSLSAFNISSKRDGIPSRFAFATIFNCVCTHTHTSPYKHTPETPMHAQRS